LCGYISLLLTEFFNRSSDLRRATPPRGAGGARGGGGGRGGPAGGGAVGGGGPTPSPPPHPPIPSVNVLQYLRWAGETKGNVEMLGGENWAEFWPTVRVIVVTGHQTKPRVYI
jgi:hypothetical protein